MENTKELESSYLIQGLEEPINYENPWSFGGGLKNGGLSADAFKMLRSIFSFSYMGAAEYEFGAIPQFFKEMVAKKDAYSKWETSVNKTPLYVIGPYDMQQEINERLNLIGRDKAGYIKCGCTLKSAVGLNKYIPKDKCRNIGWLELSNGFAFFSKPEPWTSLASLFSIE